MGYYVGSRYGVCVFLIYITCWHGTVRDSLFIVIVGGIKCMKNRCFAQKKKTLSPA